MVSMWAEITLPEGPWAGKQPSLELARHSALAPRCPCSALPRRCRALRLTEETQALSSGSLGLRGRQDTGSTLKWPVIIFFTTPIMIFIFSLCLRLSSLCLFR